MDVGICCNCISLTASLLHAHNARTMHMHTRRRLQVQQASGAPEGHLQEGHHQVRHGLLCVYACVCTFVCLCVRVSAYACMLC